MRWFTAFLSIVAVLAGIEIYALVAHNRERAASAPTVAGPTKTAAPGPEGSVDTPNLDEIAEPVVSVSGWALDPAGVRSVEIRIAGHAYQARMGIARPDVAKAKPGGFNFGSAGVGSSTHFAAEQFKLAAGIDATHVPYKGPPEAIVDTMTGRIHYSMVPLVAALPSIKDGKLLALGVTTAQRSRALQDVPTLAEGGLQGFEYQDWWGVFAPGATPREVVDKVGKDVARILVLPDVAEQLLGQGAEARPTAADEFAGFVRAKIDAARTVAASARIRMD